MPQTGAVASAKGKLAVARRWHPESDNSPLRRDLASAKLEAYVAKVVAEAPPLTPDQINRVSVLLRGGAA